MALTDHLKFDSDCKKCRALCCVALAFDQETGQFGYDKPAGIECHYLDKSGQYQCQIHQDLDSRGFSGCLKYQCYGAGPYVIEMLENKNNWQQQPDFLPDIMSAFLKIRQIFELLQLLQTAEMQFKLSKNDLAIMAVFIDQLMPEQGWSYDNLMAFNIEKTRQKLYLFLAGFKDRYF